jgi:hypothetical protein
MPSRNSQAPAVENPALATGARSKAPLGAPVDGPASIGGRYLILGELGRGGMGVVYRVHDTGSKGGHELALKQLLVRDDGSRSQQTVSLFEREFYTLAQLAHPRVIAVYDYGLDAVGPFYTMELLDGGNLKALAPLDVTRACTLMLEVCSSLALLHSRRLVHRDISPRNVRCTHDGHAKLIDFGAMVPMGPCSHTVGTPAFVAPEVVYRMNLDARTDLFSLGATLYYTLTGRAPFAARQLSDLREAWSREVIPPSRLVAGIPPALDALCAALLRLDPAQRPRSAYEVMQRLEVIAGVDHSEPLGVSQAYLATPVLIGRETQQRSFRQRTRRALHGVGSSLVFASAPGLGRSRLLDACVLEAKTLGATVLRAAANASADTPFTAAQHLCEQLLQALPEAAKAAAHASGAGDVLFEPAPGKAHTHLRKLTEPALDRAALQAALTAWLIRVCDHHALVIAVDDAPRVDEASIALLAGLALQASELRMLIAVTADPKALEQAPPAYAVLARQSAAIDLEPLTRAQTELLFASVFGNVPHLALLADRLYKIALGSPRDSLALARHLVDSGLVRYEGAQWTLPSELVPRDLPKSAADALATRVAALPPLARRLTEAQALLGQSVLRREDYAILSQGADARELDAAILALLTHEIVQSDGELYSLSSGTLAETLRGLLDDAQKRERHLALYELYHRQPGTHPYVLAQHLLAAGQHEQALDLLALSTRAAENTNVEAAMRADAKALAAAIEGALQLSERLQRPQRESHELRRLLCAMAVTADERNSLRQHCAI